MVSVCPCCQPAAPQLHIFFRIRHGCNASLLRLQVLELPLPLCSLLATALLQLLLLSAPLSILPAALPQCLVHAPLLVEVFQCASGLVCDVRRPNVSTLDEFEALTQQPDED